MEDKKHLWKRGLGTIHLDHLFSIYKDHILNTKLPKLIWKLSHVCLLSSTSLPPAAHSNVFYFILYMTNFNICNFETTINQA